jgi:hypothetical protein
VALSEAEWEELLKKSHPLRGTYEWQLPQALQLPAAVEPAGTAADSSGQDRGSRSAAEQQRYGSECIGGRAAKQAWEAAWQEQHAGDGGDMSQVSSCGADQVQDTCVQSAAAAAAYGNSHTTTSASESKPAGEFGAQQGEQQDSMRAERMQQACIGMHQQQQPQQDSASVAAEICGMQEEQQQQETPSAAPSSKQQQQAPLPGSQQQQQRQQQTAGPASQQHSSWLRQKQQRLMRWLRTPTADWAAADWGFDDASEGVLVLQLMMADGRVAAVSVRDDTQPSKPTKVSAVAHYAQYWCACVDLGGVLGHAVHLCVANACADIVR